LPGRSLWVETLGAFKPVEDCANDVPAKEKPSTTCAKFLEANERAHEQWELEAALANFEKKF